MDLVKLVDNAVPEHRRGIYFRKPPVPDFCKSTARLSSSHRGNKDAGKMARCLHISTR